ncbi:MAG: zf-HC2 domain-containing protein [Pseudomonadota bacterium]
MTLQTVMDKDRLAAFVDGEMSPEEAAEVVMHLADHPEDQAYVDELMAANQALAQAFDAPLNEPVPAKIRETIMGAEPDGIVVPFRRRPLAMAGAGLALAASVALAVVILPVLRNGYSDTQLALGPVAEDTALDRALENLPSGIPEAMESGPEIMILATLPVPDGFCREVEVIDEDADRLDFGIACLGETGWSVEVTLSEPLSSSGTEDGFVTASDTEVQSLQPFLDRLGAGLPLDAEAEADAIAQGWAR